MELIEVHKDGKTIKVNADQLSVIEAAGWSVKKAAPKKRTPKSKKAE